MNYKNFLLILLFSIITANAQKREINAEIINFNNDTIKTIMMVRVNLFNNLMINELSFIKKITTIDTTGNKTNIPAKLIKKLTFADFANRVRTFKYDGKKQLLEIIYDGKHKAFVTYAANPYDGSIVSYIDFYNTEGKRIKVGAFKTSKSALKKVVQTRPDLVKFIDESNLTHYEVIRHVLSELDKDF